jgi:hypothetical protein
LALLIVAGISGLSLAIIVFSGFGFQVIQYILLLVVTLSGSPTAVRQTRPVPARRGERRMTSFRI